MKNPFRKKPAPKPVSMPIRVAPQKPIDQRERDQAVAMHNERNADLAETEGAILRLEDKKRRLLLSIEGWKAQLDALERPEREAIDRAADELDRELALPDLSAAIADAPAEVLEAAE